MRGSADTFDLLRGTPIGSGLNDAQLNELTECLRPLRVASGQNVVSEGEAADRWYLIIEGSAAVTHANLIGQSITLAVLGPGDSFGERALTSESQPRSATVSALTDLDLLTLDRSDFARVPIPDLADRLVQRLDALAIDTALKRASPFASLPHEALRLLVGQLEPRQVHRGEVAVQEGDPGDCLYVIRSGTMEVVKGRKRVALLRTGDSFGEVAVLTAGPRTATVRALEEAELLSLSRDAFQAVASEHVAVAAYFRELIGARFRGTANQHLLIPDPISTMMPQLGVRRHHRYWAVLLIGIVAFGVLTVLAALSRNQALIYAVTVVGSLVGPVVFVQYLAESDILSERPFELLATGVLGASLGLPPVWWLQHQSSVVPGSLLSSLLIAGMEEPAKLLGVVWLLRLPALRFRMDGVIFGAAAGMGFAALETMLYGFARVETVGVLLGVLWFRALLSPFTHGTWTAIMCATLWRQRATGLRKGARTVGAALVAAILLHSLWDWSAFPVPLNFIWLLAVGAISVLVLRMILHRAADEEIRSVAALAPELAQPTSIAAGVRCDGCGRRAPPGARYCPRCGLALRQRRAS